MKWTVLILALVLPSCTLEAQVPVFASEGVQAPPSHAGWDALLAKHVSPEGWADYRGFERDRGALVGYLETLGDHPPSEGWSREARLAYFINLYNAATVLLILDHYPLESIRDIPRPWGKKRVRVGDQRYSLGEIEHGVLRKMGEPRIHFAINCASFSCPRLLPQAYREKDLDTQLEAVTREFINDPSRNDLSGEKAQLSRIFKWYRKDFTKGDTSMLNYINRYLPDPLPADTPVSFLPYNWSLNEKRD